MNGNARPPPCSRIGRFIDRNDRSRSSNLGRGHAPVIGTHKDRRVVIAHLGTGASMCGLREGRAVATTMSFSPLDGLPMGTRSDRLDAAVVLHLIQQQGRNADEVTRLLFRESELLGLSGVSNDMRALEGMAAALRGIDTLVFTGGIGENAAGLHARIVEGAAWMGKVAVRVPCTDEKAVIARHTAALA